MAENLSEELQQLKLHSAYLEHIIMEQEAELNLTAELFNITFDIPSEPTTLDSEKLTPFLYDLGRSVHITSLKAFKNTSITSICYAFGGPRFVKTVIKTKNNSANIIFYSPECRKNGVAIAKHNLGSNAPPILYCLNNYPILKHQVKCLSVILGRLKEEGKISSYSLNNFLATKYDEKLGPLYSFQISDKGIYTNFRDSRCANLYMGGFLVPTHDTEFKSSFFSKLENVVRDHVLELTQPTFFDSLDSILKTPKTSRRRRRQKKTQKLSFSKNEKMPPPPKDRDIDEIHNTLMLPETTPTIPHDSRPNSPLSINRGPTKDTETDSQPSPSESATTTRDNSRPITPLPMNNGPIFSGSCNIEKTLDQCEHESDSSARHNETTLPPTHVSGLSPSTTTILTSFVSHNATFCVPPMISPVIPFAVSPTKIGTPPAPAHLTELLPPIKFYS